MYKAENKLDVIILGGGPAGASAGLTLLKREGVSVAIVEQSNYNSYRIGESLSPGTRPLLEYLNVWKQFQEEQALSCFASEAAWGSSATSSLDYMFTIHGPGWSLDRLKFDKMLANAFVNNRGTLIPNNRVESCTSIADDLWEVKVLDPEMNPKKLYCSYIIDATGRRGYLAKQLGINYTIYDKLTGAANLGVLAKNYNTESTLLLEACEYGWWYSVLLPENKVSVVLMSDSDIISDTRASNSEEWIKLLRKMPLTSKRLQGVKFNKKPIIFSAGSSCLQKVGGKNWVAVGDAVASHDPLSSSGIPHAIGSAINGALIAANMLFAKGDALQRYQNGVHRNFITYLETRSMYYKKEQRWTKSLFWKRRISRVEIDPYHIISKVAYISQRSSYISNRVFSLLLDECKVGIKIHQAVANIINQYPSVSTEAIIFSIQELIANDEIQLKQL